MNYVIFKSGDNFDNLLHKVFNQKAKIKDKVYFHKSERRNDSSNSCGGWYQFHTKRYDYLRIAKAIMDDWNNDTFVGKYLKTINEKRVNKKFKEYKDTGTLEVLENAKNDPMLIFTEIYGIGSKKAEELVKKHKVTTIKELREKQEELLLWPHLRNRRSQHTHG